MYKVNLKYIIIFLVFILIIKFGFKKENLYLSEIVPAQRRELPNPYPDKIIFFSPLEEESFDLIDLSNSSSRKLYGIEILNKMNEFANDNNVTELINILSHYKNIEDYGDDNFVNVVAWTLYYYFYKPMVYKYLTHNNSDIVKDDRYITPTPYPEDYTPRPLNEQEKNEAWKHYWPNFSYSMFMFNKHFGDNKSYKNSYQWDTSIHELPNIEPIKYADQNNTVVFFYTNWCKYSKFFYPIWVKTISKFTNSKYRFRTINLDNPFHFVLGKSIFKLSQTPAIFICRGTRLDQAIKYTGELNEGEFTEFLTDNIVHNLELLEIPSFSNPCEENCYMLSRKI